MFIFAELIGPIPTEIGLLKELEGLWLYMNELNSTIPSHLGTMTLKWLSVQSNHLTGTVPATLGNMTSLLELELGSNELSGDIPLSLSNLSEKLQLLQLEDNNIKGGVPTSLCSSVTSNTLQLSVDCNEVTCTCDCTCTGTPPPISQASTGESTLLANRYQNSESSTGAEPHGDDYLDKDQNDSQINQVVDENESSEPYQSSRKRAYGFNPAVSLSSSIRGTNGRASTGWVRTNGGG